MTTGQLPLLGQEGGLGCSLLMAWWGQGADGAPLCGWLPQSPGYAQFPSAPLPALVAALSQTGFLLDFEGGNLSFWLRPRVWDFSHSSPPTQRWEPLGESLLCSVAEWNQGRW